MKRPKVILSLSWTMFGWTAIRDRLALRGLSLEVREGEILGIAGVSGNGQRELAEVIAGLRKVSSGSVCLKDKDMTNVTPAEMIEAGFGYIPEDRIADGIVRSFSVEENLILKDHHRQPFSHGIFLQKDAISEFAEDMVETYDIRTPSIDTQASTPVRWEHPASKSWQGICQESHLFAVVLP